MRCKIINGEDYKVIAKSDYTLSDGNVPGWYVTLQSLSDEREEKLFFVNPKNYKEFEKEILPYYNAAKSNKRNWSRYYDFKNHHIIIDDLNRKTNNFKLPSKDLGYIFSSTVHKSQGSTYTNFCLRLIYVAISRAKQSVKIYI